MKEVKKITQIIPANGWKALYELRDYNGELIKEEVDIACFALVELVDDGQRIFGVDLTDAFVDRGNSEINFCEQTVNFVGYKKV